jgi:hypothetical protein
VGLARGFWMEILWDCFVENMQTSWEDRCYGLELEGVDDEEWKDGRCVILSAKKKMKRR